LFEKIYGVWKSYDEMKNKPKSHARAEGMTHVGFSLSKDLLEEIDALAKAENRNRSNFIVNELSKIVERKNIQKKLKAFPDTGSMPIRPAHPLGYTRIKLPLSRVAEEPAEFEEKQD